MKSRMLLIGLFLTGCAAKSSEVPSDPPAETEALASSCAGLAVADPHPASPVGFCTGGFVLGDFEPNAERLIRDAGYEWNNLANRGFVHFGVSESRCSIVPGELSDGRIVEQRDGIITIDVTALAVTDPVYFRYAVMHAMGRAIGMSPTDARVGIMTTCTSDPWFTKTEADECARLGICTP